MQSVRVPPYRRKHYVSGGLSCGSGQRIKFMLKPVIAGQVEAVAEREDETPSARWALASLSLAMLLPSLGTSSANVALPTLAQAFGASFQQVQWIVLAYL